MPLPSPFTKLHSGELEAINNEARDPGQKDGVAMNTGKFVRDLFVFAVDFFSVKYCNAHI